MRKLLFFPVFLFLSFCFFSCDTELTGTPQLTVSYQNDSIVLTWTNFYDNKSNGYSIFYSDQIIEDFSTPYLTCGMDKHVAYITQNLEIGKTYHFAVALANNTKVRATSTFVITPEVAGSNNFKITMEDGKAKIYKNGEPFYIQGIGGTTQLSRAASYGANAFRTWDASYTNTTKELNDAKNNNMYLMMGIWLSQNKSDYTKEAYKTTQRSKINLLLREFKTHPNLMIWCLGNETNSGADTKEAWEFIDELAGMIKAQDPNHPVATVITHSSNALNNIARYTTNIDVVGLNTYGGIYGMVNLFANSQYKGPYMVSEWGPNGPWENGNTSWGAPIEPSSENKRVEYEKRYGIIQGSNRSIGSFVFLWGQKEERTPTWFSMFVEKNVAGLPIDGEACPTVETMEKLWTKAEPKERAPIVDGITMNGKKVRETEKFEGGSIVKAVAAASDPRGYELTYHWEILKEATVLGSGGSYEPRPDRVGEVITGSSKEQDIKVPTVTGNYRLYVYVLNGRGMVGTSNIPFQVERTDAVSEYMQGYKGTPYTKLSSSDGQIIPGKVMLAYFDDGGEGVAWHDSDTGCTGGFRSTTDVDSKTTNNSDGDKPTPLYNPTATVTMGMPYVGYTVSGEWFNLIIDVLEAGTYNVDLFYSANGTNAVVSFAIDGKDVSGNINLLTTGYYHQWHEYKVAEVELKKGRQVLTFKVNTAAGTNFASLNFSLK